MIVSHAWATQTVVHLPLCVSLDWPTYVSAGQWHWQDERGCRHQHLRRSLAILTHIYVVLCPWVDDCSMSVLAWT
ncbi:hypothetical protein VFPPC_17417 [Pochonia chlamydosporia 170]|uniref:Uncharacterized protein n=1 Tax=Pochonia chlamydosporia 170 TaxID=1380566 RepID=A0A219AT13_METCM|nr:hypothetical protein VFPPC_17417 [Pochonia chlamydosporia 170]OWT43434.1 hypothetical protein VFPPC_17417 [Pochonia chlamydosporia 170]